MERSVAVPISDCREQSLSLPATPHLLYAIEKRKRSWFNVLVMPLLYGSIGVFLLYRLDGFPPTAWSKLYLHWSQLAVLFQQGHSTTAILLIMQAFFWLLAWSALLVIAGVVLYRVLDKCLSKPPSMYMKNECRSFLRR